MAKTTQARDITQDSDGFQNQDEITLGVLTAIERDANLSQRMISSELGVALGLANAYLKRCARKGWIKIQQVPSRRYAYYLTPQGFSEKTRLTGNYLSASFTFFRRAREQMAALLAQCVEGHARRVAFAGVSELAEVGILCAQDNQVELIGIIDPAHKGETFRGLKVVSRLSDLEDIGAVLITDLVASAKTYDVLKKEAGDVQILAPALLGLSNKKETGAVPVDQADE